MAFDIPLNMGDYEERYQTLGNFFLLISFLIIDFVFPPPSLFPENYFAAEPCKYVEVAPKHVCTGTNHLEKIFQDIMDGGGEGIIIRDPNAPYQAGRSRGFLKHKVLTLILLRPFPPPPQFL